MRIEAGICYIYTLLSLSQNIRLSRGVTLLPNPLSKSACEHADSNPTVGNLQDTTSFLLEMSGSRTAIR
jgi:hypothetical protein